jgi:NADP-reducing hydrogenase subunit HndB
MNLKDLRELRESARRELAESGAAGAAGAAGAPGTKHARVIVGMGTCGIAAGAEQTLAAFREELALHNLQDVAVSRTGCMGLCHAEPTVEVIMAGMPRTIYGKVSDEVARQIVRRHVLGGVLVNHHVYDRPAADIVEAGRKPARASRGGR